MPVLAPITISSILKEYLFTNERFELFLITAALPQSLITLHFQSSIGSSFYPSSLNITWIDASMNYSITLIPGYVLIDTQGLFCSTQEYMQRMNSLWANE
jgi:hypothetical protein